MPNYQVALTMVSHNSKTGPIPVSTTESSTCPPTCGEYKTCYAKFGQIAIHWRAVDAGDRGVGWDDFCSLVRTIPRGQLWRHNQAGDLPGDGVDIDADALRMLVQANKGRRGFTYTHYPLNIRNLRLIEEANKEGFTINISVDSITDIEMVREITTAPLSVVLPSMTNVHSLWTLGSNKVVVCPATYRDDMNCARCRICAESAQERAVIGFPAHGSKRKTIDIKLLRS